MNNNDTISAFDNQLSSASIIDPAEPNNLSRPYLTGEYTHHESQAFNVQLAVNPLVSAAAPLLHLAKQLRAQQQQPDLDNLHKALSHEMRTLEYRAHSCDYPPQVILGARYFLCVLLDEIIMTSSWGRTSTWQQQNLLNAFQQEMWGGERFFVILERCSQNPTLYIDLLELGYLCLSLGLKGQYLQAESSQRLECIIDNLYKLIRRQRGDFPRHLAIDTSTAISKTKSFWRLPPLWLTVLLTALILTGIFLPYHYHLQKLTQPVYQLLDETNKATLNTGANNG